MPDPPPAAPAAPGVLGFLEITFDGIGTPNLTTSALAAPSLAELDALRAKRDGGSGIEDEIALELSLPRNVDGSGDGTIQLALDSTAQFVHDSTIYLQASFMARNAQLNADAYDTDRLNLTFYGVSAANRTIDGTAVLRLSTANRPADPALARLVLPTGLAVVDNDTLNVAHLDVLQVLTEGQIGGLTPPEGVTTVFPYGFVVRNANTNSTRTLSASPDPNDFEGAVDFAVRIPQQGNAGDDPQSLSLLMLAVDDSEVWITQSLEGQNPDDWQLLRSRAGMLGAIDITLLPGGAIPGVSNIRRVCVVRTAGTAAMPTAHLVNVNWTFQSFNPSDGTRIPVDESFQALFDAPVEGAGPDNFRVIGQKSGPAFQGQTYDGNGTPTITTPNGSFTPGEKVQIYLTSAVSCPDIPPRSNYRVQSGQATGAFQIDASYDAGDAPATKVIADLTGNGNLDLVVVDTTAQTVAVLLGNGDGTFQAPSVIATGDPSDVAVADEDGDGILDIVLVDQAANAVSVLIGAGDGTFPNQQSFAVGTDPVAVATEDFDSDGHVDAVVVNGDGTVSVLAGNGDGTLHDQQAVNVGGAAARHVSIHDLNGDPHPDIAFATSASDVVIVLGNGNGTFQAPLTAPAGEPQRFVATADLDGDGARDIVFVASSESTPAGNSVHVMLGNGDGTFGASQQFQTGQTGVNAASVEIADVTGDGMLDLVTPNLDGANVTAFLGAGDGTFPIVQSVPLSGEKTATAVGDLDGDTILDLVVATSDGVVWVLLGQAS